ncbi:MAG: sulfur carrier protein ThiS [Thermoanaerobaculia bacterium]|nr:sulfur carrier protein ThiS [Thermoanaerobaculia bacterium]
MSPGEQGDAECDVIVNGDPRTVPAGTTLTRLIEGLGLHPEAVAVELNGSIVRRASFAETRLGAGDRVEVVRFVQGGLACLSSP